MIAFVVALTAGLATLSLAGAGPARCAPAAAGEPRDRAVGAAAAAAPLGVRLRMGTARAGASRSRRPAGCSRSRPSCSRSRLGRRDARPRSSPTSASSCRATCPSSQDVDELQDETGVSGEVDVTVHADDLTDPAVDRLDARLQEPRPPSAGYTGPSSLCVDQDARLCPCISLADLFGDALPQTSERVEQTLDLLPALLLLRRDRPRRRRRLGDTAMIPFGIKVMPLDEQKELIDAIRAEIDPAGHRPDPPPGSTAEVVGLPVLAADANSALSSSRYLLALAGLLAVALALLAVYRSVRRALVPLVPIVLATGWSALGLAMPASRSTRCRRRSARW